MSCRPESRWKGPWKRRGKPGGKLIAWHNQVVERARTPWVNENAEPLYQCFWCENLFTCEYVIGDTTPTADATRSCGTIRRMESARARRTVNPTPPTDVNSYRR